MSSHTGPTIAIGGGAVPWDALYLQRKADSELLATLQAGVGIAFLFAPTQIGKSSMCARTSRILLEHGVRCVYIDLSGPTTSLSATRFYASLFATLGGALRIDETVIDEFWRQHENEDASLRWRLFLERVVLGAGTGQVVLIFDEVDATLRLREQILEFFGVIRAIGDERTTKPDSVFKRLSVVYAGRRAPEDFKLDPGRDPFRIGRPIEILDFTRAELDGLRSLLAGVFPNWQELLDCIHRWTGGHPFLTIDLCHCVLKQNCNSKEKIDELVRKRYIEGQRSLFGSYTSVADRLELSPGASDSGPHAMPRRQERLLTLYRSVRLGTRPVSANYSDRDQKMLVLSGLCRVSKGQLVVRSALFGLWFDREWIQEYLATGRPYDQRIERWHAHDKKQKFLLSGPDLEDARAWRKQQPYLTQDELDYLAASERASVVGRVVLAAVVGLLLLIAMAVVVREQREQLRRSEVVLLRQEVQRLQDDKKELLARVEGQTSELTKLRSKLSQVESDRAIEHEEQIREKAEVERKLQALRGDLQASQERSKELEARVAALRVEVDKGRTDHQRTLADLESTKRNLTVALRETERAYKDIDDTLHILRQQLTEARARSGDAPPLPIVEQVAFPQDAGIRAVALSNKKPIAFTGDENGKLWVWSWEGKQAIRILEPIAAHSGPINDLKVSRDGNLIASVGDDYVIRIWDVRTFGSSSQPPRPTQELSGHTAPILAVAWDPGGTRLATASADRSARVYQAGSGLQFAVLRGHSKAVVAVGFDRTGERAVTGGADKSVRVWELTKEESTRRIQVDYDSPISYVSFAPNGQSLIVGTEHGTTSIVRLSGRRPMLEEIFGKHPDSHWLAFLPLVYPAESFILTGGNGGAVIWEAFTGQKVRILSPSPPAGAGGEGSGPKVQNAAFTPDGEYLLTGGSDKTARLWRLRLR